MSEFTKQKIIDAHGVEPRKIKVFPNTIDPLYEPIKQSKSRKQLYDEYGIGVDTKVLLSACRLFSTERYKGYDRVIKALPEVKNRVGDLRYLIVGRGDKEELNRVKRLCDDSGVSEDVIIIGEVGEEVLKEFYAIADLFVLPSKGEGFGIVFIEALMEGNVVIGGRVDATKETLLNGELGILVDPDNTDEIASAISEVLCGECDSRYLDHRSQRSLVLENYGFGVFKQRLHDIIQSVTN